MPPKFIFLRHGEARHNVLYHEEGESAFEKEEVRDASLTPQGLQQAKETALKLSKYKILDIWSSPLTRCIQTAIEAFEETSASHCYLHDYLLERQGGNHVCNERKAKQDLHRNFAMWNARFLPEMPPRWFVREDWTALHYRMKALVLLLADIYKNAPDDTYILLVSHRDAILSLTKKDLLKAEFVIFSLEELLNLEEKNESKIDT
jgi:broad specificity phosphatase PhoE